MTVLLLIVIYIAFISLGLPDSLLGVSWPSMSSDLSLPLDTAGLIAMVTISGTILSSLVSGYVIRRIGTGWITFLSSLLTGSAILLISFTSSLYWILLFSLPLGIGAGSVDSALNNYVAHHFKAHHMNWLHSFWGVGATLGPVIVGQLLQYGTWRKGYQTIGAIQLFLAFLLLISMPLWSIYEKNHSKTLDSSASLPTSDDNPSISLFTKGIIPSVLTFFFYVGAEMSVGLWGSTYLVQIRNVPISTAASWIAFYYGGITAGRFVSGFFSFRLSSRSLVRYGILLSIGGIFLIMITLPSFLTMTGFVLTGLGFAPVFPGIMHDTPTRFGNSNASIIIGYQMAAAFSGGAFLPPLFGLIGKNISMNLLTGYLLLLVIILLLATEALRKLDHVPSYHVNH